MGETEVHQFQVFLSLIFGVASFIAFLFLIDYAAKFLRPVSLVGLIGEQGIEVIESVYPNPTRGVDSLPPLEEAARPLAARVGYQGRTGAHGGALRQARRAGPHARASGAVEGPAGGEPDAHWSRRRGAPASSSKLAPQVGDFVPTGEPLFYVYGDAGRIDEKMLREQVAFGTERTMEQDPMFSFRILVDIAAKALSPAINDPTTAVLAIDQLHRLLRLVGLRDLRAEEIADDAGEVRLIVRTPNWEDFVTHRLPRNPPLRRRQPADSAAPAPP